MTLVSGSIFDGIRMQADAALLSRALTLINNQSLSRLEDLRADLASGEVHIRFVQPDDAMPASASAIYVARDEQSGRPGYLVLRPENLSRATDASVLSLVDDLNHEDRHHGNLKRVLTCKKR